MIRLGQPLSELELELKIVLYGAILRPELGLASLFVEASIDKIAFREE